MKKKLLKSFIKWCNKKSFLKEKELNYFNRKSFDRDINYFDKKRFF